MSQRSITDTPEAGQQPKCIHCGDVKESWLGSPCQCSGAQEARAARAAVPTHQRPVTATARRAIVDSGLGLLRREGQRERAAAARQAARDARWEDVKDSEITVKEREIARREQRQDTFDADAASMDADAPAGQTLADFTVAFAEGVDLTSLPAVVERNDGETVLYSGKLNWVFGLPGSGKSWVSLIAIDFAVARGGNVLIMDFEDSAATFQRRAALVGFSPAVHPDNFRYARPGLADAPTAVKEAQEWLADAPDGAHSLVVIDAAESSGCPSDGADVNPWLAKMVHALARRGRGRLGG